MKDKNSCLCRKSICESCGARIDIINFGERVRKDTMRELIYKEIDFLDELIFENNSCDDCCDNSFRIKKRIALLNKQLEKIK